jgi:hypothetical protein
MADVATVRLMLKAPADGLVERIGGALRDRIGIQFAVEVVDDIERSEYKVRRWHDERVR